MPEVANRMKGYAAFITALAALIAAIAGFWKSTEDSKQAELLQKAIYEMQQGQIKELGASLVQLKAPEEAVEVQEVVQESVEVPVATSSVSVASPVSSSIGGISSPVPSFEVLRDKVRAGTSDKEEIQSIVEEFVEEENEDSDE